MKIALVYWNCAFHCFFLLFFQWSDKTFIYLMYLLMPKNVGTDIEINFLCQILGKLLSFYKYSKWCRPYWWPSWISSCAEKQISFFLNHVCEKLHHNACRFYIETTHETKKLYVCPCNVWLYCVDSSLGGHLGFHMLINIPSLDWHKFTSYASVWLKSLMMEIGMKNTRK